MPHYLIQGSYSAEGLSALISSRRPKRSDTEGNRRRGGTVESLYFCFGDYDLVAIFETPDNVTMAALSMVAGASGAVTNIKTTVLIPITEGVEAARKAAGLTYRPPGA